MRYTSVALGLLATILRIAQIPALNAQESADGQSVQVAATVLALSRSRQKWFANWLTYSRAPTTSRCLTDMTPEPQMRPLSRPRFHSRARVNRSSRMSVFTQGCRRLSARSRTELIVLPGQRFG